jgi:hypothetical protein
MDCFFFLFLLYTHGVARRHTGLSRDLRYNLNVERPMHLLYTLLCNNGDGNMGMVVD